jgi:SOS-response transcriptional repressor LexA
MRGDGASDGMAPAAGAGERGEKAADDESASPYLRSLEHLALNARPIPDASACCWDVATVPLLSAEEACEGAFCAKELVGLTVEVPLSVLRDHPHAHAIVVEGNCMDRVAGDGAIVVFDPDVEPSNGRIAVVETQDRQVVVRRWYKGVNKLLLAADSHERFEDIVIDNDRLPRVLGAAVHIVIPPSML